MDPQPPTTAATATTATTTTARTAAEPSQPQPLLQPPQPQPPPSSSSSSSSLPPSSSSTPPLSTPPNPNPNNNPIQISTTTTTTTSKIPTPTQTPLPQHQPRPIVSPPSSFNRNPQPSQPSQLPQQQPPQSHFSHFSSLPPQPSSAAPTPPSSAASPSAPRGGIAIGVPAHHQSPSPPFSSSFGQHFGGLGRTGGVSVADSASNSNTSSQVRMPMPGMGMLGSLGSGSQMRPGGMPAHQQRPVQSSLRPPVSAQNNQTTGSQSFQGHGLMRTSSVGSPASPSPNASQSMQSLNQPWLSSGPQGKPPLPASSYRQQLNPQSLQQRSHIPQQQQSTPTASPQQQPLPSNQSQEHFGQVVPPRPPHVPQQQQVTRPQGPGNQKPSSLVAAQSAAVQPGIQSRLANADADEPCNSILSKRSIHELVSQVDPSEKLDPEVADILVDIAENFLESITRSGCSLAKHRKSSTLEAKDILLHLEKNWNMTLPGFGGDEIKGYRRQLTSDIHKERLAAIKKSMIAAEAVHAKGSAGQAFGGAKGSQAKAPLNFIGSPNLKN